MKYKIIFIAILIIMALSVVACSKSGTSATIIVVGRHANANMFSDVYYNEILKYIEEAYKSGGYVRIIVSDGNPRQDENNKFVFYPSDEPDRMERPRAIRMEAERIVEALKNEEIRAKSPENSLLEALHAAERVLNELELAAKGEKEFKQIGKSKIIILDTGIVTAGVLDFTANGIDKFNFNFSSDEEIVELATGIADRLNSSRQLPDLKGADVDFIGICDVAPPQTALSPVEKNGIRVLWQTILSKCNTEKVSILPETESTHKPNNVGFPPVRPIRFTGVISIDSSAVGFIVNTANFINSTQANDALQTIASDLKKSLGRNSSTRLYIVGSESKEKDIVTTELSEARAMKVMETLVGFGVPATNLEAFGLAVSLPRRVDDRPNGVFNEELGAKNRIVMIIPSDIGDQALLKEVLDTRDRLYGRG